MTVKARALAAVRLTVETTGVVPLFPSRTERLLIMRTVGEPSSFRIVTTPCGSEIVALVTPLRLTKKTSLISSTMSPITTLVIVRVVTPGGKVKVPLAAR